MKQEGRIFALEALPYYKKEKSSLKTFLTIHIRNRFLNLKRKQFSRYEPPCTSCPFYIKKEDKCGAFEEKQECDKYTSWLSRNMSKRNLAENSSFNDTITQNTFGDSIENREIFSLIDKNISIELRRDFLCILEGTPVPKYRREKVFDNIREILKENCADLL